MGAQKSGGLSAATNERPQQNGQKRVDERRANTERERERLGLENRSSQWRFVRASACACLC